MLKLLATALAMAMVLSSPVIQNNYGNGCSVTNDMVHECDGTSRRITAAEKRDMEEWNVQFQKYMQNQFPPGFPFVQAQPQGPPPQMKSPCKVVCTTNYYTSIQTST
ncbi:unnamed protein product [Bursaphelenchus okinawaensis]|uniref:Pepsin inhibitor-3-like repeated domain-containing protein n=1 Tax=Bursaphelenchus okinawaensis TaxID=465554 RepID=A0A811JWE0_9BILA|nr:unnamed protein product [Bursaphelenchus okinawaensis]CAG9086246.1 unnamed protein product [Bursaphelenchus okinawaensis]